jgi:hypothetical protein
LYNHEDDSGNRDPDDKASLSQHHGDSIAGTSSNGNEQTGFNEQQPSYPVHETITPRMIATRKLMQDAQKSETSSGTHSSSHVQYNQPAQHATNEQSTEQFLSTTASSATPQKPPLNPSDFFSPTSSMFGDTPGSVRRRRSGWWDGKQDKEKEIELVKTLVRRTSEAFDIDDKDLDEAEKETSRLRATNNSGEVERKPSVLLTDGSNTVTPQQPQPQQIRAIRGKDTRRNSSVNMKALLMQDESMNSSESNHQTMTDSQKTSGGTGVTTNKLPPISNASNSSVDSGVDIDKTIRIEDELHSNTTLGPQQQHSPAVALAAECDIPAFEQLKKASRTKQRMSVRTLFPQEYPTPSSNTPPSNTDETITRLHEAVFDLPSRPDKTASLQPSHVTHLHLQPPSQPLIPPKSVVFEIPIEEPQTPPSRQFSSNTAMMPSKDSHDKAKTPHHSYDQHQPQPSLSEIQQITKSHKPMPNSAQSIQERENVETIRELEAREKTMKTRINQLQTKLNQAETTASRYRDTFRELEEIEVRSRFQIDAIVEAQSLFFSNLLEVIKTWRTSFNSAADRSGFLFGSWT